MQLEILKKIDQLILTKIEELQAHPEYQKIADKYANLEENIQEIIKIAMMLILTVVPFFFFLIIMNSNSSLKNDLKERDEFIHASNELVQKKAIIANEERQLISPNFIDSESGLKNKITNFLNSSAVDTSKIQITNFDVEELRGGITQAKAEVKVKNMTADDLFNTLSALVGKGKMRIDDVSIRKSNSNNLLEGMISVMHLSREIVNTEND
jgi:hypothetical protein